MIGTIRKHSTVLWIFIITIVIITFVFWGSNTSSVNDRSRGDVNLGRINGEVVQLDDYRSAMREVYLLFFLSYGEWPDDNAKRMGFDVERETYFRLLMLQKLKQEKIHVADETVAKVAAELLRAMNRGQAASIAMFEQNVLKPRGLTALDFERYLRNYLGIQQLMTANGLSGRLVTPAEARMLYERENEEVVTEAVFFAASNYTATVAVSPEAVGQFFTNQMARYRLPERVQVSYVAFEISNLLSQAEAELVKTNLNEMIEANLERLGTNYFLEAKTPEEKRAKMREELIKSYAMSTARKQANEFARATEGLEKSLAAFEKLAADRKVTVRTTAPFDREDGPKDVNVGADFTKESFLRSAEEPFYGPLIGREAAYVIALKGRLPSEIPTLDAIRDRVTADYKQVQSTLAARKAGDAFVQALTNGLAGGKKFSSICTEANVKPTIVPPLAISTRSVPEIEAHVSLNQYKSATFTTPVGQASNLIPSAEGGFVVFVREKLPLNTTLMNERLPGFVNSIRMARLGEAYQDWFRREAERGLRETPVFRQQQQQLQPGGAAVPAKK